MNRREWLRKSAMALLAAVAAWPLFSFITAKRYRPPRKIRIRERIPAGEFLMESEFVLFEADSGPVAVSRTCTHLGCTVTYDEIREKFICPCHQSMFNWNGKYISGPAKKDLAHYPVEITEDGRGYVVLI